MCIGLLVSGAPVVEHGANDYKRGSAGMKMILLALLLTSCYSDVEHIHTVLPDGNHTITITCNAPTMDHDTYDRRLLSCDEEANSLCPFGFSVLNIESYAFFDPKVWGKSHHESMTVICQSPPAL